MLPPDPFAYRYSGLRLLGRGGFGVVYRARDTQLERDVAIKILNQNLAEDSEWLLRFRHEAVAASRLSHPNITVVFDVGEFEGNPYIVMEFAEGQTVARLIGANSLTDAERLLLLEQLCDGLHYAHQRGVVHRDIKPSNLVVREQREGDTVERSLKILDFGLARITNAPRTATLTGHVMFTPNYVAPETIQGFDAGPRTDQFAVGAVAYELLVSTKAFEIKSTNPFNFLEQVKHKIVEQPHRPMSEIRPDIDPELVTIVDRALAKVPDERYQDLAEMRRQFRRVRERLEARSATAVDAPVLSERDVQEKRALHDEPTVFVTPPSVVPGPSPSTPDDESIILSRPPGIDPPDPSEGGARLVVSHSGDVRLAGKSFDLKKTRVVIGRGPDADIGSSDRAWSRLHAVIEYKDRGYFLRDMGGTNGMHLDGRRVKPQALEPLLFGAQISIGTTTFRLVPAREIALPDLSGAEVAGRYVLDSLLRESAHSALYTAHSKTLPAKVALKLLSPQLLKYPGYRERFRRRAEITSQLQHPHVCRISDLGQTRIVGRDGTPIETEYLCLDLLTGGSLADRLDGGELIPIETVERWVRAIAEALSYAHGLQILHGDLKPAAIVFDESARANPYVTDFALGPDRHMDIVGTPAYMAPEQWDGEGLDVWTDQFGLGLLAYYMITGTRPFEGQEHPEIRRRNFTRGPLAADEEARRQGRTNLNPRVSDVLARSLAVKPKDRYHSVREFAEAFAEALSGGSQRHHQDQPLFVFFSYHRESGAGWATHIATRLREKHQIEVFLDVDRFDGAGRSSERIARAIRRADIFVCLLGPATLESEWVRNELRLAHDEAKPMIPIFQENYAPPGNDKALEQSVALLLSYDGVYLLDRRNIYIESAVEELAKRIKDSRRQSS
jgi:serine/threonine protein kinase